MMVSSVPWHIPMRYVIVRHVTLGINMYNRSMPLYMIKSVIYHTIKFRYSMSQLADNRE